jgi:hypothetical protein
MIIFHVFIWRKSQISYTMKNILLFPLDKISNDGALNSKDYKHVEVMYLERVLMSVGFV